MPALTEFVRVPIDAAMRAHARREGAARRIQRTRASPIDAYIGVLGELVWAKLRYGNFSRLGVPGAKGQVDDVSPDAQIEVKTSKTKVHERAHLMVREDYARARQPTAYVLVLIPEEQADGEEEAAFVCGWATHEEVLHGHLQERLSRKTGAAQGYRCYEIAVRDLHPVEELLSTLQRGAEAHE
ncbi:MAG: hypothetical protein RMN52_08110 [Anaerolineae bacterium]|nr:hypothetical protein [Candidatus Roseilinea sp.]MDW8449953.1 hypothetical protein [Anaerolineae bacterium]